MNAEQNIGLSTAEVAALWSTYMGNSMAICVLCYFLKHIKDTDVQPVLEYALSLSKNHVSQIAMIFEKENHPIPQGFTTSEDVNLDAPRLYSDAFYLFYLKEMGRFGMINYALSLTIATRQDVFEMFTELIASTTELHNRTTKILLSKGIYVKPPYVPYPDKTELIKNKGF